MIFAYVQSTGRRGMVFRSLALVYQLLVCMHMRDNHQKWLFSCSLIALS